MAIADLVSGKVTEPLSVRALVGERAAEPGDVLLLAERHGTRMIHLKFTDLLGTWQHLGMALASLDEEALTDGSGFDGSSIRGFQEIDESDMLLLPDLSTAVGAQPRRRNTALPQRRGRVLLRARGGFLRL